MVDKKSPRANLVIKKNSFVIKNDNPISQLYEIGKKPIGSGTYGEVLKAKHKVTGQERAIKKIPRTKIKNWDRFKTEV